MSVQLITTIQEAFRSAKYPGDSSISIVTYDDEGTTEHFCQTHWKDHSADELGGFTSSITFFTPEAFAYFLPAFMIAAVQRPANGVASSLLNRICPPKFDPQRSSYLAWWSLLSRPRQEAIVEFLREMRTKNEQVPELAISALETSLAV